MADRERGRESHFPSERRTNKRATYGAGSSKKLEKGEATKWDGKREGVLNEFSWKTKVNLDLAHKLSIAVCQMDRWHEAKADKLADRRRIEVSKPGFRPSAGSLNRVKGVVCVLETPHNPGPGELMKLITFTLG